MKKKIYPSESSILGLCGFKIKKLKWKNDSFYPEKKIDGEKRIIAYWDYDLFLSSKFYAIKNRRIGGLVEKNTYYTFLSGKVKRFKTMMAAKYAAQADFEKKFTKLFLRKIN